MIPKWHINVCDLLADWVTMCLTSHKHQTEQGSWRCIFLKFGSSMLGRWIMLCVVWLGLFPVDHLVWRNIFDIQIYIMCQTIGKSFWIFNSSKQTNTCIHWYLYVHKKIQRLNRWNCLKLDINHYLVYMVYLLLYQSFLCFVEKDFWKKRKQKE